MYHTEGASRPRPPQGGFDVNLRQWGGDSFGAVRQSGTWRTAAGARRAKGAPRLGFFVRVSYFTKN